MHPIQRMIVRLTAGLALPLLVMLTCVVTPAAAQAPAAAKACPTAETAAKGYKLTSKEGRFLEVTRITGDMVEYREKLGNVPGAKTREQTAFRGLLLLSSKADGMGAKSVFEADLKALFPLKAAATHDLHYLISMDGNKDRAAHLTLEVASGEVAVTLGACSYQTIKVKKTVLFLDTKQVIILTDYWSPALSMYLKREVRPAGAPADAPPVVISFDTIEPTG